MLRFLLLTLVAVHFTEQQALNFTFLNVTDELSTGEPCILFFSQEMKFEIFETKNSKESLVFNYSLPYTDTYNANETSCGNTTAVLAFDFTKLSNELSSIGFNWNFTLDEIGYWGTQLRLTNLKGSSIPPGLDEVELETSAIWAPLGRSYHCTIPDPYSDKNGTSDGLRIAVQFIKLQVQPFGIQRNQFGIANDCVGFFTTPILSGLFVVLMLGLILALGFTMMANIETMDRFDDAKTTKPLQIKEH